MWTTEHTIETTAMPQAIWRLWSDVGRWPEWNTDLERSEVSGSLTAGSAVTMYPRDQDPIELTIVAAEEPFLFVDEADLGDVVVRTTHRVERVSSGRSRVVYAMEITGPAADPVGPRIGPEISADFPQVLAALVQRAER
jgi:hypothetical protein